MKKEYFLEYYKLERNHWWFIVREKIIIKRLRKIIGNAKELNILNIGVATGRTTEVLSKLGNVVSVEYDKDCCLFTKQKLGINVVNASILDLPFENEVFDLVCAFDVIEHVEFDKMAVDEMLRVCKHNGIISITVPAVQLLWSYHDEINNHYRRYLLKDIKKLFNRKNGKVVYKSYFNSLLFLPILFFRLLSHLLPKKLIRKGAGSDFTLINKDNFLNRIFYRIFSFEALLLEKIIFPIGVSLFFIWKKG